MSDRETTVAKVELKEKAVEGGTLVMVDSLTSVFRPSVEPDPEKAPEPGVDQDPKPQRRKRRKGK